MNRCPWRLCVVVLQLVVGCLFVFTGTMKVTDRISSELYAEGLEEFVKFTEVLPLKKFGLHVEPIVFLTAVGWIELVGGLLLILGPRILQEVSNIVLSIIMMGAIYSLLMLKKPLYMCIPATICLGILLLLLYVWGRDRKKQKDE
ncbi:transmembrane protein 35B-like isoform X1 [Pristis pectinata]|uniref:transmembrane protein 35B-like isoform X1 n=1 Tax=Pristis pectinata TaxID=685728 RepID=UPI00223E61A5|nr:transmembrane protein 35B-like isoform X1 [Pristis pectinata]